MTWWEKGLDYSKVAIVALSGAGEVGGEVGGEVSMNISASVCGSGTEVLWVPETELDRLGSGVPSVGSGGLKAPFFLKAARLEEFGFWSRGEDGMGVMR